MASAAKESSISVTVRVRPFTQAESSQLCQRSSDPVFLGDGSFATSATSETPAPTYRGKRLRKVINVVDDKMLIFDPPENSPIASMQRAAFPKKATGRIREHRFVFDRLFDENASQEDVYCDTSKPLIDNVLNGYNATVFAYGATGCGKTHTISGTPEDPGIIFLTMKELFERIDALSDTKAVDLSLSYLEIYNETIRDLLAPPTEGAPQKPLILREDADRHISVSNLSSHRPQSVEEVMDMILRGNQNRTMSPTEANATSSRSHAVLQINVTQKDRTANLTEAHTFGTLSMIDLAGSERASATKNRGERLLEGANINKSLLALGNCINALCDPRSKGHVPYRDSKLTRLLKFSLGGNCKTVMIVCVSPSSAHYDETLNTLKYADRAKRIKTKVTRNEHNLDRHVGSYLKMITEQKAEIEQLRAREAKAGQVAVDKHLSTRKAVQAAIADAVESFKSTITRTEHDRQNRYKCLSRLRTIECQLAQLNMWIDGIGSVGADSEVAAHLDPVRAACDQMIQKLHNEKSALTRYMDNTLQDHHALDAAITSLSRRLSETPGCTDQDVDYFIVHAENERYKCEIPLHDEATSEIHVGGSLAHLTQMYFDLVNRLHQDGHHPVVNKMVDDALRELTSSEFNSRLDMKLPFTTSTAAAAATASGTMVAEKVKPSFKRSTTPAPQQDPKRHTVILRSPISNNKKPTKRVRWEDDSAPNSPQPQVIEDGKVVPSPELPPGHSAEEKDTPDASMDGSMDRTMNSTQDSTQDSTVDSTVNSIMDNPGMTPPQLIKARSKKFGVKGELRRSNQSSKHSPVLGMNKRAISRIEKENLGPNVKSPGPSSPGAAGGSKDRGFPLRVAVPTAASAMKSKHWDGKS